MHRFPTARISRLITSTFSKGRTEAFVHKQQLLVAAMKHESAWGTVLAPFAMRIQRIVYLSRQDPALPADTGFSRAELDAVILLGKPKGVQRGELPSLGEVARWRADLGGYTGTSSGGPFGQKVLARSLDYIAPVAQLLAEREL